MASSIANRARLALACAALMALPGAARADDAPRDPAMAQSLFDRARVLMDAGRFADACPLLAESQRLDPGGGTLLNHAVCLELSGKLASAHARFQEALGQAIKDGRADRRKIALERIAALAPRLSTISIVVPPASRAEGLTVRLDGSKMGPITWGVPAAVDGGTYNIEAAAPGYAPWSKLVEVGAAESVVEVRIPVLAPLQRPAPSTPVQASPPPAPAPALPPSRKLSRASWITGGVGVGLAALATATGIAALVLDDSAEEEALAAGCNLAHDYCPKGRTKNAEGALAKASTARALGWIATSSAIAGGITLLTAALLPRTEIPVTVKAGAGWISVGASF